MPTTLIKCYIFPNIWGILLNLLHLCGDFSKNLGNSTQNTYRFAVIMGTNEETIQIFSEAGSFIWWFMRIFQVFLIFSIRVHYVCVLYTKNVIVKYSQGIHHAGCQNVCCSKCLTRESITK